MVSCSSAIDRPEGCNCGPATSWPVDCSAGPSAAEPGSAVRASGPEPSSVSRRGADSRPRAVPDGRSAASA
eukprot:12777026-Alexandrium_andersonii.AAC.1